MITATTVVGIDVSRDWLDGFCFPGEQRFRLANSAEGHELLLAAIREMPGPVKIGFEGSEDQKSIRGIDFPNYGWSGMGALGHACCGRNRRRPAASGADQGLCPFPGHAGEDRPDRCRDDRPVHAVPAGSRSRAAERESAYSQGFDYAQGVDCGHAQTACRPDRCAQEARHPRRRRGHGCGPQGHAGHPGR